MATVGMDNSVRLWNAATGKELRKMDDGLESSNSLAFSPDGSRLAGAGTDKVVRVWQVNSGKLQLTLKEGDGGALVAFSTDGKKLFVGGGSSSITFYELPAK